MTFRTWLVTWALIAITKSQLSSEDEEAIDNFISDLMECRGMPGVSMAIVKEGQTVLSKGYGFANMETNEPVTEHTIFPLASTSKTFTSTLLGKLFADSNGELSWDTVLSSVVEDQFYLINGYVTNHTKFRDAISHQTGMSGYTAPATYHAFDSTAQAMQAVGRSELASNKWKVHRFITSTTMTVDGTQVKYVPKVLEFREEFNYQTWLYMSAMYQLELITGEAWQDMMTSTLLSPLGMSNTTFYERAAPEYEGFAQGYVWDTVFGNPDELVPLPFEVHSGWEHAGPGATVCSTASDMSRWMEFILSGGLLPDGTRLMETSDLERIWYPEVAYDEAPLALNYSKPRFPVTDSVGNYGLAYWNGEYRGYKTKVVSGDLTGFHSDVFFLPMVQLGIFFVTNFGGHYLDRRLIHMYVADILLGYEPAFNSSEACEILNGFTQTAEGSRNLLKRYQEEMLTLYHDIGVPNEVLIWWAMDSEGTGQGMPKEVSVILQEYKEELLLSYYTASENAPRRVEPYVGVYGEFMHGNLTIDGSDFCEGCLDLEYGRLGRFILIPTNDSDVFVGFSLAPPSRDAMITFGEMGEESLYNEVYLPWDVSSILIRPVTFTRGLTMDQAPDFPIESCD